jgi:photosystem II stability/assembly factor-like uncharacterized protein/predicted small lipoprotein YifL
MSRSRHLPVAACLVAIVVLSTVLAACGAKGSDSATPVSSSSPASQSPSATPTTAAPETSPTPSATPAATVPAGFKAASVTFVSLDEAFVLGTAPGRGAVMLHTLDRGRTWTSLAAPAVGLGSPQTGAAARVWGTRFATPSHGFVFGKGLWETTDGGAHWARAAAPSGAILSLATIDGRVLALVQKSSSSPTDLLVRRPLGGGPWVTIHGITSLGGTDPTDLISTQAGTAAVLNGGGVLVTKDGGLSWRAWAVPSTSILSPSAVAATSAGSLALLDAGNGAAGSMQKLVYTSANGGATWTKAGAPGLEGDPVTIAGGSPATLLVGAASGASLIFRSSDGGRAWKTALVYGDGGMGWADLGFTSPTHVVVVHGPADRSGDTDGRAGQLLLSSNGAATWQAVRF